MKDFRKGDKLIPVITAVVLFNPDEWDAPMSIHEMLNVNPALLPFIPNYGINLIALARIDDRDFSGRERKGKFYTGSALWCRSSNTRMKSECMCTAQSCPQHLAFFR